MSALTAVAAECKICGFTTTDETQLEMWNGYGDCIGPEHFADIEHMVWTRSDGTAVTEKRRPRVAGEPVEIPARR